MDKPPARLILIFLFVAAFIFCPACSSSLPAIAYCDANIVLDFKDQDSGCEQKLSVFTCIASDARRIESILVKSASSPYRWLIEDPVIIESGPKQWAGHMSLKPAYDGKIPEGNYSVIVTDASGNETESMFSIQYNESLLKCKASEVKNLLNAGSVEKIAVYSDSGDLLYFDVEKEGWQENVENVWKSFNDAAYLRTVVFNGLVVCMLPPVYRNDK